MQKDGKILEHIGSILLALDLMVFFISAAVVITLAFKPLYYYDMSRQRLADNTGYTEEEIVKNYDELIDYNLSASHKTLKFPTFPMSKEAEIHFREVKTIFQNIIKLCFAAGVIAIFGGLWKRRHKEYGYLYLAGIFSIVIPLVLGSIVAINWDWFFVAFHKTMFQNDYWLFDPVTDPVILVLPDVYFMHCAEMILILTGISAAGCFLSRRRRLPPL